MLRRDALGDLAEDLQQLLVELAEVPEHERNHRAIPLRRGV
jgi:hypothetical protein